MDFVEFYHTCLLIYEMSKKLTRSNYLDSKIVLNVTFR